MWRNTQMAKALFGHVGTTDPRAAQMQLEMARLRMRVADLEAALERECRATSELQRRLALLDSISIPDELTLDREPALL
jgi:hypothetical protein